MGKPIKHLIRIHEPDGVRAMLLNEDSYSIGRDKQNDIVLLSKTVSRFHARLIKVVRNHSSDISYQIMDGDTTGKPSTNGITVNGQFATTEDLDNGDCITIGNVKLSFYIEQTSCSPQAQLLNGADLQQFKDLAPVFHPKATLVDEDLLDASSLDAFQDPLEDDLPETTFFAQQ